MCFYYIVLCDLQNDWFRDHGKFFYPFLMAKPLFCIYSKVHQFLGQGIWAPPHWPWLYVYSDYFQELENTRNKLADAEQLISSQDKLVRDLEEKIQENSFRGAEPGAERSEGDGAEAPVEQRQLTQSSAITHPDNKHISDPLIEEDLARLSAECKSLQELVQKLEEKNANLQVSCLCIKSNQSVLDIPFLSRNKGS